MACALVCVCAGLVAGCGDADDSGAGNGMPNGGLGEQRFDRIGAVLEGGQELEDFAGPVDALTSACERLDRGDQLLAALRRSCAVTIKLARRLTQAGECDGDGPCEALGAMADAARQQVGAYRAAEQAIEAARLDSGCAGALKSTDEEIAYLEAVGKAFDLLERSRTSGSTKDAQEAERLLKDAAGDTDSGADRLERFRKECGST